MDIISPSRCFNCKSIVPFEDSYFCKKCRNLIKLIDEKCERCSGIISDGKCILCSEREFYIEKNISIVEYTGVVKDMVHSIKFENYRKLLDVVYPMMIEKASAFNHRFDLITYIPMSRDKEWKRGFNQSRLIAEKIAKKMKIPLKNILKETKKSESQRDLGYRDRFINVIGRYTTKKRQDIENLDILIIDDIFTTGSTLNECARILKESGANKVFSLTFARAGLKRLEII